LGDDVHDVAIQAQLGPLPGQRETDQDQLVQQRDPADGVDQPVHLHAPAGGQRSR
jgi:hypothetical protein